MFYKLNFQQHTIGMNPENKGWAIGNTPELACAHNSHAIPQARKKTDKNAGVSTGRFTGLYLFNFYNYIHKQQLCFDPIILTYLF